MNGQVEAVNKIIMHDLERKKVDALGENWIDELEIPYALFRQVLKVYG